MDDVANNNQNTVGSSLENQPEEPETSISSRDNNIFSAGSLALNENTISPVVSNDMQAESIITPPDSSAENVAINQSHQIETQPLTDFNPEPRGNANVLTDNNLEVSSLEKTDNLDYTSTEKSNESESLSLDSENDNLRRQPENVDDNVNLNGADLLYKKDNPGSPTIADSSLPADFPPIDEEKSKLPFFFKIFAGIFAFLIFIIVIIIFSLISFKGGGGGKVTLTYWGLWEDSNIMQGVISDFERIHPDIVINYQKQDPNGYSERLLTRIQNGSGPDIFRFHNSWMPMVLPVLAPLPTSVISSNDFSKNYYPVIVSDLSKNGAIYGLPLDIDTLALFTNNKLFQAVGASKPKTWDDFVNDARLLTVKDASGKIQTAGAAFGTYSNITHASDIMSLLFAQNGVDFNNFSQTASNGTDALTFYTSFVNAQNGVNTNTNVWDDSLPTSLKYFAAGKVGMYFGYSWDIFTIQALNPNLSFSISSVPHLPGRDMTIASYWVEGVSNKSKYQKQADEFMAYLAQKSTLEKLYSAESQTRPFGELYPRIDMVNLLKNNQLIYPFLAQASSAVSSYFNGETFDSGISDQMNGYISRAVNSVLNNTSSQTAMDTLIKGVAQVLSQYGKNFTAK